MELWELQRNWNQFGQDDPLWAILTDPAKSGGRWNVDEFFALGDREVISTLDVLHGSGYPVIFGTALDFGCGVGRLTQALARHFESVTGLDIAPTMIDAAQRFNRFGDKCRYLVNEQENLAGFDDSSVDFVFSLFVLQHMHSEYSTQYLREFLRVLKPGGVLVFQLPCLIHSPRGAEPLPDSAYKARIEAAGGPGTAAPGTLLTLHLTVTNEGESAWPGGCWAGTLVCAGNHWLDSDGQPLRWDDARVPLPQPLRPGDSVSFALQVSAPATEGQYLLELDMVHEENCWFAERGSPTVRLPMEVSSGVVSPPQPVMEMYGRQPHEVLALIEEAGGQLIQLRIDPATAPPWISYRYFIAKRG